jgi:hypothetical protein
MALKKPVTAFHPGAVFPADNPRLGQCEQPSRELHLFRPPQSFERCECSNRHVLQAVVDLFPSQSALVECCRPIVLTKVKGFWIFALIHFNKIPVDAYGVYAVI